MGDSCPAHKVFSFGDVTFSSNFDSGNLANVERESGYSFTVWIANDNLNESFQSKCFWYHFAVTGVPMNSTLVIQIANATNHPSLYKFDMRPVYRSCSTNQKWLRLKNSIRYIKYTDKLAQLHFNHTMESDGDTTYFAFTYPYSYTTLLSELDSLELLHKNNMDEEGSIYYQRELLTYSCDGRRIELLTVSSVDGAADSSNTNDEKSATISKEVSGSREKLLEGLFPESKTCTPPLNFPGKKIVFVSARVHPGEVPAQHTFKGILNLLMDPNDLMAKELRRRYVFKMIPMLNPDGVYRGHSRMDQHGQNLNRYYTNPDPHLQPSIFAAKSLINLYAESGQICMYLDLHAHASKRSCFIYGNVLNSIEDQIQNQLYCRLIALNTPHFDYDGCLFSREHMTRIDPCDMAKGLTAEGSGRVNTYLQHKIIHSYTLECNYNMTKATNEVPPAESDSCGNALNVTPASTLFGVSEKYTPCSYTSVGRACIVAILDIRGHNPCSRILNSKFRTLDKVRESIMQEVNSRKEYKFKLVVAKTGARNPRRRSSGDGIGSSRPGIFDGWRAFETNDENIDNSVSITNSDANNIGVSNCALGGGITRKTLTGPRRSGFDWDAEIVLPQGKTERHHQRQEGSSGQRQEGSSGYVSPSPSSSSVSTAYHQDLSQKEERQPQSRTRLRSNDEDPGKGCSIGIGVIVGEGLPVGAISPTSSRVLLRDQSSSSSLRRHSNGLVTKSNPVSILHLNFPTADSLSVLALAHSQNGKDASRRTAASSSLSPTRGVAVVDLVGEVESVSSSMIPRVALRVSPLRPPGKGSVPLEEYPITNILSRDAAEKQQQQSLYPSLDCLSTVSYTSVPRSAPQSASRIAHVDPLSLYVEGAGPLKPAAVETGERQSGGEVSSKDSGTATRSRTLQAAGYSSVAETILSHPPPSFEIEQQEEQSSAVLVDKRPLINGKPVVQGNHGRASAARIRSYFVASKSAKS